MSPENKTLSFDMQDWIGRCREALAHLSTPPYLDAEIPELEQNLPFDYETARAKPELVQQFAQTAEKSLALSPGDLGLRLAALYPLRRAAVSIVGELRTFGSYWATDEESQVFKHLVALCVPERLTGLDEIKFELYNAYLAANWEKAEELFLRLAVLGFLPPSEMFFLRGQFWFLSVFGRQIEFEMSDPDSDLNCEWTFSLPSNWRRIGFDQFPRPELLKKGSPAHWVLMAWSANPKMVERYANAASRLPQIGDDGLLLEMGEQHHQATPEEQRLLVHQMFRDFKPIEFPTFSDGLKARLTKGVADLCKGGEHDRSLGVNYRPLLARAEFALGNFPDAAKLFKRALEDKVTFEESEDGTTEYQWQLMFSAAWSFRQAGDYQQAVDTLLSALPWPGAGWWVAKFYSECGKYEAAAEFLKLESETALPPPESWLLSSTLALGEIAKEQEGVRAEKFVRELERKSPEFLRVLHGFTQQYWPQFCKLERESQQCWIYAECLIHKEPLTPEFLVRDLRSAVKEFGWVLENELRTKIFKPFREQRVHSDRQLLEKSRQRYDCDPNDPFLAFIVSDRDVERVGFTLGQMIKVLEGSVDASNATEDALQRWLKKRFERIHQCIPHMWEVNSKRREAIHHNPVYKQQDVLSIASLCRQALNWV
jgi:tetratricopeptide (TPR) repeat protein